MEKKRRNLRPSPAMIVAIVALIVALAGTAVAGGVLNKKKVNKIISNRAPGLSVAQAKSADNATSAANATNAANAQPVAFAHVSSTGTLDTANSKNVGAASRLGTGIYCLGGIPFAVRGGQATVDEQDSGRVFAQFQLGTSVGCPTGTQDVVVTLNTTSSADAGFFVVLYG